MRKRESIDELLNATEGEHYQFKEWKSKDDFREAVRICSALANCGGGKLVLGVTDKRPRKVVGSAAFPQPERTRIDLMNKLRIRIDFYIYKHENGRVLVFDVASRPIGLPVQVDGSAWWYHSDSLIPMPEDVRRTIYAESGHDFSGDICPDVTIHELDDNAIEIFRKTWMKNSGNARIAALSKEQLLRDCSAITDKGVTYAALILFGKREAMLQYLPHAEIRFEYRSSEAAGPAAQREDFLCGFFNSFDRVWNLVNLRNDQQHYQDGFFVHPIPTFNEMVVREALLNAVSHRDYKMSGNIFVRQYSSKIVIENPGGFPQGITVENILDRNSARNARIAYILQLCGLVERAGQGMNLIYEQSIKEAKPLPDFSGSDAWFIKLTLNGKIHHAKMLSMLKKLEEDTLKSMTTDDYLLLAALYEGKGIDNTQVSRFKHLIELGIVKHTELGIELVNGDLTLLTDMKDISPIDGQSKVERLGSDGGAIEERLGSDWGAIGISERKRQIIDFFVKNEKPTSLQLAEHTGLTQGRVRKILKELAADGLIEKVGNYRYTSYTVKNKKE